MMKVQDTDFYAWSMDQARRLRGMTIPGLDIDYIAEELERLGLSERGELLQEAEVLVSQLSLPKRALGKIAEHRKAVRTAQEASPSP